MPVEALEECGVLAVDRQQEPSPRSPSRQCEVAGRDEALLVREGERDSVLERPEGRPDAGEADDGVQHEIGLRRLEDVREVAADLDVLDAELRGELVERLRSRCERADRELGVRGDDLERLPPDGSRRPEQGDSSLAHARRLAPAVFRHRYAFPNARIVK